MVPSRARSPAGGVALAAAAAAFLLSGCQLLYPELYSVGNESFETVRYTSGAATLTLGGETDEVRHLELRGGSWEDFLGATAVFQDDAGWAVTIRGGQGSGEPWMDFNEVEVHRAIIGHWVARSWQAPCDFDIEQADTSGFRGTAICEGLRWTDAIAELALMGPDLPYIEDEPPFDATITFAAESDPSTVRRTARPTEPRAVDLDRAAETARALATVEEVRGAHILISPGDDPGFAMDLDPAAPAWAEAEGEARGIAAELRAVTDPSARAARFAELARIKSDDDFTREQGGDLGAFTEEDMVPEFAAPLFGAEELTPGDILGPVRTEFGWHVILYQGDGDGESEREAEEAG